jgi:hypothetical protein
MKTSSPRRSPSSTSPARRPRRSSTPVSRSRRRPSWPRTRPTSTGSGRGTSQGPAGSARHPWRAARRRRSSLPARWPWRAWRSSASSSPGSTRKSSADACARVPIRNSPRWWRPRPSREARRRPSSRTTSTRTPSCRSSATPTLPMSSSRGTALRRRSWRFPRQAGRRRPWSRAPPSTWRPSTRAASTSRRGAPCRRSPSPRPARSGSLYCRMPPSDGGCGVKPTGVMHEDRSKRMNSIASSSGDSGDVESQSVGTASPFE